MKQSSYTLSRSLYRLLSIATLGVLLAGCSSSISTDTTSDTSSQPAIMDSSETSSVASLSAAKYNDGTYSAQGSYTSPAGPETEDITLTLKDNVISDATFKGNAIAIRSQEFQKKFSEGFKEEVVGKSIDELSLTVVNGSSLTPKGFMDAVSKIKIEAQA